MGKTWFTVLGVNVQDEGELAEQLAEQTGVTYPLALDEDGSLLREVEGRSMPTTLLISADGHVVHRFGGESTPADELTGLILEHLVRPAWHPYRLRGRPRDAVR